MIAGIDGGPLYISTDGGLTWTIYSGAGNQSWSGLTISDDVSFGASDTKHYSLAAIERLESCATTNYCHILNAPQMVSYI